MGSKIDAIMKDVNKRVKDEAFTRGMPVYEYKKVPFTSPKMNHVTHGGLPLGRLIEFYGEEGGGKTTTTLDLIANFQQIYPDKEVIYIDAENTLDLDWARKIGVDTDAIYLYQPKTESAEEIFQTIKEATLSGETGIWVLDSIPCLTSKADLEKEMTDDARLGGVSGILTRFCREMVGPCAKNECMGIFINQVRAKIGSMIPGQMSTPGGQGLKHFCTARIQFSKGTYIDESGKAISRRSGEPNSQTIMVNMEKTKFCRPDRHVGQYTINFEDGIDYLTDVIDMALQFDIIKQSGAWYSIVDINTGEIIKEKIQGKNNLKQLLSEGDAVFSKVSEVLEEKIQEN